MFIEKPSSAMRTPAGCDVPASLSSTRASDEHCTPLGCARAKSPYL